MAIAPVDFQVHNSLFLIAHFHSMAVGGVLFGVLAGFSYWFPKIFGFKLNEKLGSYAAFCWIFGFLFSFIPLYILGLMGATRRLDHYDATTGWQPLFIVAGFGVCIILLGIGFQVLQLIVSIRQRKDNMDTTGDPWNGRTLEWSTTSPPPFYNFAVIPEVDSRDPFWTQKHTHKDHKPHYDEIHMPKNTPHGLYIGALSFLLGFAFTWHILWLGVVSVLGIITCVILRLFEDHTEYAISATEVARLEAEMGRN